MATTVRRSASLHIEHLEEGPIYTVYLDAGSFNWLVEILEAKTLTQQWLRPYQRLVKRTLLSFEEARRAVEAERPRPTSQANDSPRNPPGHVAKR